MGWTSSADPLENVGRASLFFYTKEEAMAFCDKHGWEHTVDMPNVRSNTRQKRFNAYSECQAHAYVGPSGQVVAWVMQESL